MKLTSNISPIGSSDKTAEQCACLVLRLNRSCRSHANVRESRGVKLWAGVGGLKSG